MRLYVGILGAEQFFNAVDRQLLDDIDIFATAVIALAGITFGVFIGQLRTLRLHHRRADIVFGSDQLHMVLLALDFLRNGLGHFGVKRFDCHTA